MGADVSRYGLLPVKTIALSSFLIIIFLLGLSNPLSAQNIDNLNIEKVQEEGLSNDFVICINQDNNGFLWVGTREGLFRYDGYSFKAFKNSPVDSTSLIDNSITAVCPEKNKLWVGSL